MNDTPAARWKKVLAVAVAVAALTVIFAFRDRLHPDFWPLDASRVGPNLIASAITWAALFILAVLLYPPLRRRVHRFLDHKLDGVKAHIDAHHVALHERLDAQEAKHEKLAERLEALHDKFDNQ